MTASGQQMRCIETGVISALQFASCGYIAVLLFHASVNFVTQGFEDHHS